MTKHSAAKRKHNVWRPAIAAGFLIAQCAGIASAQSLELFDSASAGTTFAVSVAALTGPGQFVTAIKNSNNDLEVIAWQNNTDNRTISRLDYLRRLW
ncbi:MAG TPA: hypothetical protein VN924_29710 [Bryobacteraceae bacterium]|nr:hypothetical protein [Bryobacteraceae bacterium]